MSICSDIVIYRTITLAFPKWIKTERVKTLPYVNRHAWTRLPRDGRLGCRRNRRSWTGPRDARTASAFPTASTFQLSTVTNDIILFTYSPAIHAHCCTSRPGATTTTACTALQAAQHAPIVSHAGIRTLLSTPYWPAGRLARHPAYTRKW